MKYKFLIALIVMVGTVFGTSYRIGNPEESKIWVTNTYVQDDGIVTNIRDWVEGKVAGASSAEEITNIVNGVVDTDYITNKIDDIYATELQLIGATNGLEKVDLNFSNDFTRLSTFNASNSWFEVTKQITGDYSTVSQLIGATNNIEGVDWPIVTNIADNACKDKVDRVGDTMGGTLYFTNGTKGFGPYDYTIISFNTNDVNSRGIYSWADNDAIAAYADHDVALSGWAVRDIGVYAHAKSNWSAYIEVAGINSNTLYVGGGSEFHGDIRLDGNKLTSLAPGSDSMDAVNVSQLTNALNTANQPALPLPIGATDLLTVNRNGTNFQANRALVITPQGTHIYTSNTWDCPGGGFYYIHNTNSPVTITIPEVLSYRVNEPIKIIKTVHNGEGGENYPVHVVAGGTSLIGNAKTQTIYNVDEGFGVKNAYNSDFAIQSYVIVQDSRQTKWDDSNSTIVSGSGKVAINFTRSTTLADNMNNLASTSEGATIQNLNDSDGNPTPFDITVVNRFVGSSVFYGYDGTNDYPVEANIGYFYATMTSAGRETGMVVFTGLDNSKDYIFKTFSSRQNASRTMQIDSYGTVTNSQVFDCGYNTNVYRYLTNSPVNGEISLATLGTGTTTATRNGYLNWVELIYPVDYPYVRKDGSVAMTGDLNMGGNVVSNMADGVADTDGATVGQTLQKSNQVFMAASIGFMYFTDTTGTNGFISTNLWVLGSEQFNALSNALKQAGF